MQTHFEKAGDKYYRKNKQSVVLKPEEIYI